MLVMMSHLRPLMFVVFVLNFRTASAQLDFEQEPILYSSATATDPVARLIESIKSGESRVTWEPGHGYLKSLMVELNVPESSQVLVFS